MTLRIIHSNRVERLLDGLAERIRKPAPGAAPLEPETVLIDNPMLGSWINLRLALRNSVAANIRYPQPAELFWDLARRLVDPELPERTPLEKAELAWRIHSVLGDAQEIEGPDFAPVRAYLAGDGTAGSDRYEALKRYQLAVSVADLYDQYLVYRPQWFNAAWDRDEPAWPARRETATEPWQEAEAWQRALWRRVQARVAGSGPPAHRAAVLNRLLQRLQDDPGSTRALEEAGLRRLSVFGITAMPETRLDLLMLLGRRIDVDLYLFNPCRHAWFHIRTARQIARLQREGIRRSRWDEALEYLEIGHPLLASQATQVREFVELILDKSEQFPFEDEEAFEGPPEDSLLGCLQQDVLELEFRGAAETAADDAGPPRVVPPREREAGAVQSVHFHDCHSPLREVEVLHDQLLDMFATLPGLKPRDVVVMMPRVSTYAPYIHAVFGSAPRERFIQYHITDRSLREESPLLNGFETLLRVDESRLPLSEVLSVLEVPAVRRRFGLDREGFEQARRWLIEAGVRWGEDAAHRAELGLPAYAEYSWEFGFHRLLAGYAMHGDDATVLAVGSGDAVPVVPLDEVEGGNAATLDGLLRFWQALRGLREKLRSERSLQAWHALLARLLEDFFAPEDDDWRAIGALRTQLEELEAAYREGWHEGAVPVAVVREAMRAVLNRVLPGRHPWSEGVKFCSLLPMRGVPFRVVWLLGMNLDDYPRRLERRSFDLMRDDHRPGDRSARTDDRWLFLEALLSARDVFHVSFRGRGVHRNETLQPSVVVSELIDTLRRGFALDEAFDGRRLRGDSLLCTRHPLQPFDQRYFRPGGKDGPSRLISFSSQAFEVARAETVHAPPPSRWAAAMPEPGAVVDVDVDEFLRFFTGPWEAFFRARQVWFDAGVEAVRDEEDFAVAGGLERWQLKNQLLERASRLALEPAADDQDLEALRAREVAAVIERRRAAGAWPVGGGAAAAERTLRVIDAEFLFASAGQTVSQRPVDVELAPGAGAAILRVAGELRITGDDLLVHTVSRPSLEKLLDFYLRAALADAGGEVSGGAWRALFLQDSGRPARELAVKSGDERFKYPLQVPRHRAAARELLETLAPLLLAYRQGGLPFDPELGFHGHALGDDGAAFEEKAAEAWAGSPWNQRAIAADLRRRSYYGSEEALLEGDFRRVAGEIWCAVDRWLSACSKPDEEAGDG